MVILGAAILCMVIGAAALLLAPADSAVWFAGAFCIAAVPWLIWFELRRVRRAREQRSAGDPQ